jgi:uncharacterized protein YbjT (DUF2867 family)
MQALIATIGGRERGTRVLGYARPMRILVTGALGFMGTEVVAALRAAGHDVVRAVRASRVGAGDIACDFARDLDATDWLPRLEGIDAVVNLAGILRETRDQTFEAVHARAPQALARACARMGITRFVQVSALGRPEDAAFIASKHQGDAAIARELPVAVILRPGLIYSTRGAYGGTALLRGIAALPGFMPLPRGGTPPLQPVHLDDFARAVLAALTDDRARGRVIEVVGPRVITLGDYLQTWRRWLGLRSTRIVAVPRFAVTIGAELGERFGHGPVGRTMMRMLDRGVVGADDALKTMRDTLGLVPRPLDEVLAREPAQAPDRLAARMHFVVPGLIAMLCVVW